MLSSLPGEVLQESGVTRMCLDLSRRVLDVGGAREEMPEMSCFLR